MTAPDHIGADPALGVGAGQTRRGTPATLAHQVLDLTHEDETVTVCSVPDNKVAALARTVIAVAELADELDAEGNARMDDADPGRAKPAYAHVARIRAALNGDRA